jgi:hypothetical protein
MGSILTKLVAVGFAMHGDLAGIFFPVIYSPTTHYKVK